MPFDIDLSRENLEGLPENVAITDLYEQGEDGKYRFVPKINGVKPIGEFDKVNEALRKERGDHKAVKDRFKALGDRDVDEVLAQLDEIDELRTKLENADGIPDDKIEEMVEKRLARIKAPLERDMSKITTERDEALQQKADTQRELDDLHIGRHLQEIATKNCDPNHVGDIVEIGRHYLTRDENGEIVTKDDSPLPAIEWLKNQMEEREHWNKPTGNGGGGRSKQTSGGGTKNPWSHDNYDYDRRTWRPGAMKAQSDFVAANGIDKARQMAEAAGTSIERPVAPHRPAGRAAA